MACLKILGPQVGPPPVAPEVFNKVGRSGVIPIEGPRRKRYYPVIQHADLVVTSYPVLLRDAEELTPFPPQLVDRIEALYDQEVRHFDRGLARLVEMRHDFDLALGNDADADRFGVVAARPPLVAGPADELVVVLDGEDSVTLAVRL